MKSARKGNKTKQSKAKQSKAKQSKAKQSKAKQSKAKQKKGKEVGYGGSSLTPSHRRRTLRSPASLPCHWIRTCVCRGQKNLHNHSGTCAGLLRSTGRDVRGKRGGRFESRRRDVLFLHFFAGHVGSDIDERLCDVGLGWLGFGMLLSALVE